MICARLQKKKYLWKVRRDPGFWIIDLHSILFHSLAQTSLWITYKQEYETHPVLQARWVAHGQSMGRIAHMHHPLSYMLNQVSTELTPGPRFPVVSTPGPMLHTMATPRCICSTDAGLAGACTVRQVLGPVCRGSPTCIVCNLWVYSKT